MTGPDLSAALHDIGWTDAEAARRLRVSRVFIGGMKAGRRRVPDWIAERVQALRDAVVEVVAGW